MSTYTQIHSGFGRIILGGLGGGRGAVKDFLKEGGGGGLFEKEG